MHKLLSWERHYRHMILSAGVVSQYILKGCATYFEKIFLQVVKYKDRGRGFQWVKLPRLRTNVLGAALSQSLLRCAKEYQYFFLNSKRHVEIHMYATGRLLLFCLEPFFIFIFFLFYSNSVRFRAMASPITFLQSIPLFAPRFEICT